MIRRIILVLVIFIVAEVYFYQAIKTLTSNSYILSGYWLLNFLLFAGIIGGIILTRSGRVSQAALTSSLTVFLSVAIPKLAASPIMLIEDFTRLFRGFPPRNIYASEFAIAFALCIFAIVLFGLTRGKHFYRIRKETLHFPDLPEAFDGFTITQISDIHVGSFTDKKGVEKGVTLANEQQSDLLLFTGDLVNHKASEMEDWIETFARLSAPYGKYSVLGNHDYGDYIRWENPSAKAINLERLKAIHREMGFRLLLNESVQLEKDGQSIALIGVENWGKGGFHQYGDIRKATSGLPLDSFKVLLSHDPSHWDEVNTNFDQRIHLTLAGHTHGMQLGVELFGFKWSPIKYFYKNWAGLYNQEGKYLYVNRGFGYHGLKGRIGVWPEITVLTLRRSG